MSSLAACVRARGDASRRRPDGESRRTTSRPPSAPSRTRRTLFEEGSLTVGTDQPVFQPWFGGKGSYEDWEADPGFGIGNPASGEGYESEVTYAVAEQLGFSEDDVVWTPLGFNESYKPGPEGLRLLHRAGRDPPGAGRGGHVQRRLLPREPGTRGEEGHADRRRHDDRGAQGVQARRPGGHHQLQRARGGRAAGPGDRRLQPVGRRDPGPQQRADRRLRRGRADRVRQRADRRGEERGRRRSVRRARARTSASCSIRGTPWWSA